jgi:hypothetical protein
VRLIAFEFGHCKSEIKRTPIFFFSLSLSLQFLQTRDLCTTFLGREGERERGRERGREGGRYIKNEKKTQWSERECE